MIEMLTEAFRLISRLAESRNRQQREINYHETRIRALERQVWTLEGQVNGREGP